MSDVERTPLLRAERRNVAYEEDDISQDETTALKNCSLPEEASQGRKIGWSSAYIIVVSRVIGSGIFAMPGVIVQNVGSPGLALVLWIIGALVAWAGLVISIEFGAMLPRSGGIKVYLEYVYRRPRFLASTMVAVNAVLLGFTATNCIVFAKYSLFASGLVATDFAVKLLAVGLLTAITIIHGCFYKTGILVQNLLGWLKIGLTIFIVLIGVVVLAEGRHIPATWEDPWAESNWEWNNLSAALFKIIYSFAGLDNINNVLNEVKKPVSTIKSVGPAGLLTACITYTLVNFAYLSVVPLEQVKNSRELIAAIFFERLGFGRAFLPVAIALSAAGNVMVVTFSLARLNQEVARKGLLPFPDLLASNKPFNAPMGGLIVHWIPSFLVIILPPSDTVYSFIADVEGYAGQFFALAVAAGLVILRRREPNLFRPFKAWLPAVWIRILLSLCLIIAPLFPPMGGSTDVDFFYASYALVGISVIVFGLLYWVIFFVIIPKYRGYRLEESPEILNDGTTITKIIRQHMD